MNISEGFINYIKNHNLATDQDKILVAVSGGVDSMVLLELFAKTNYQIGVAHCNFELRGEESDQDEDLVINTAKKYDLPCYNKHFDTKAEMVRTGESMEMAARRLRYTWFDELCRDHKYTIVAIAHHTDDSVETFFINLLRGTGLRGLTGISTQVGKVIRPLMFASRKEILEYAVSSHTAFREDSSNRTTKYLRNKIRLGLIPRIKEINTKFTELMQRNIENLTEAQLFIDSSIEKIRKEAVTFQTDTETIHVDKIDDAYPKEFVIYELLNSAYGFKSDVINSLIKGLKQGLSGRTFYSRDYVAYLDRNTIIVKRIKAEDICEISVAKGMVRSYCGNSALYYEYCDIDQIKSYGVAENIAQIDADKLQFPLTIRRWQQGDWFIPFGMNGRKKVSDFLIDQKVPIPEKDRQFVLISGEDIVWLVGRRIDDRYKLTEESVNVVKITKEIV